MKKQNKSSKIKTIKKKKKNDGVPLRGYVPFKLFRDLALERKIKHCGNIK